MNPIKVQEQRFLKVPNTAAPCPWDTTFTVANNEPNYTKRFDNDRALLFPLYLTSFCLWDSLQDQSWLGAEQVLVLSASSKTSIGLGYALQRDQQSPKAVGVTSSRNLDTVLGIGTRSCLRPNRNQGPNCPHRNCGHVGEQ